MNKKQAFKSVLFCLLFVVMLIPVTYMVRTGGVIKDIFTGFYAEPDDTIDVVMIGSSPVYPCFAGPKMWGECGFTAYPLASNVQRPKAAIHLVEEALKTQSPELFIFEMRMFTYTDEHMMENMAYTRGVTDNMKYSCNRIRTINDLVPDVSERYTYYFDIIKYHDNWKTMVLPEQYKTFLYEKKSPLKGYLLKEQVEPGEAVNLCGITETKPIPEEQEETLRELLEYLSANDLQALFVISPTDFTYDEQKMCNYMQEIVQSYGYQFLDMNAYREEIGIDFATDFYDGGGHANALGAEKCTDFLEKYLLEHYDLSDKRGQEKYASWDLAYETWKERSGEAKRVILDKVENTAYDGDEIP
ncbi:MAG: SGNH/GDSL hydrolase family protein [Lachnospiraceae bacterium]